MKEPFFQLIDGIGAASAQPKPEYLPRLSGLGGCVRAAAVAGEGWQYSGQLFGDFLLFARKAGDAAQTAPILKVNQGGVPQYIIGESEALPGLGFYGHWIVEKRPGEQHQDLGASWTTGAP